MRCSTAVRSRPASRSSNGRQILVYKDMGLVSQVFDESTLSSLKGHVAIGHTRYSTTGASVWDNAQPTFRSTATGSIGARAQRQPDEHRRPRQLVDDRAGVSGEIEMPRRIVETSTTTPAW